MCVLARLAPTSILHEAVLAYTQVVRCNIDAHRVRLSTNAHLLRTLVNINANVHTTRSIQRAPPSILKLAHFVTAVIAFAIAVVTTLALVVSTIAAQEALVGTAPHTHVAATAAATTLHPWSAATADVAPVAPILVVELYDRRASDASPSREAIRPVRIEVARRVLAQMIVLAVARLVHVDQVIAVLVQIIERAVQRSRSREVLLDTVLLTAQVTNHRVAQLRRMLGLRSGVRTRQQLWIEGVCGLHGAWSSDLVHQRPATVVVRHIARHRQRLRSTLRLDVVHAILRCRIR